MSHLIAAKVIHFIKTTKEYQQKKRHWAKHYTKRCRLNTCFLMVDERYLVWYIIPKKELFRTRHPTSHSPSSFAPDKSLCFTCSLRPFFSRFRDIYFTKWIHHQEKSALFFDFFSLSPHILPYTYKGLLHLVPPSIIYFHGERQSNISPLLP